MLNADHSSVIENSLPNEVIYACAIPTPLAHQELQQSRIITGVFTSISHAASDS